MLSPDDVWALSDKLFEAAHRRKLGLSDGLDADDLKKAADELKNQDTCIYGFNEAADNVEELTKEISKLVEELSKVFK